MSLRAKVISIGGDQVVLQCEDGQSLRVTSSMIEGVPVVGQDVAVLFVTLGQEQVGRERLAQDLLNQLLKG